MPLFFEDDTPDFAPFIVPPSHPRMLARQEQFDNAVEKLLTDPNMVQIMDRLADEDKAS